MITSHGYQAHALHHQTNPHQSQLPPGPGSAPSAAGYSSGFPSSGSVNGIKEESEERDMTSSARSDSGNGDPFSSAASFGDDDFEIPPINIPPSALEDNPQVGGQPGTQHPGYHYQPVHQSHPHQHPQMQQWSSHQQQQQHWGYQQHAPQMNGYQYADHHQHQQHYGYNGAYGGMYSQQAQQQQPAAPPQHVMPGGPSPVGSHNTPSPQAHSEDGDDHIRNNNILKRPSPDMYGAHRHMIPMVHPHGAVVPPPGHAAIVTAKKPKMSKRKKKRDPNEPQKPVSAYALFFRDRQASIKVANPNAAFGDVSKIVASMWDGLDPDSKAAYKKRTENAKKEYLKKLAAYRASLVSKGNGDHLYSPYGFTAFADGSSVHKPGGYIGQAGEAGYGMGQPIPPRPPMQHLQNMSHQASGYCAMVQPAMTPQDHGHTGHQQMHNGMIPQHSQHILNNQHNPHHQLPNFSHRTNPPSNTNPPHGSPLPKGSTPSPSTGPLSQGETTRSAQQCSRPGCSNLVQRTRDGWNNEFCSNECVVGQCREVYTSWSGTGGNGDGTSHQPTGYQSVK